MKIVRENTERFKDASAAEAEGYSLLFGCVSGPDAGAMGLHYVNLKFVASGLVDATRPQIIIYEPMPDEWHGRMVTLDSDWARLTEPDFDEASSRLRRLARTYLLTYEMAGPAAWDGPRDPAWTLSDSAEHVSGVYGYADYAGNLR